MATGSFFKADIGVSGIEQLLDEYEKAKAASNDSSTAPTNASGDDTPAFPTIEDFLDEEDITRECRGDNKRLITYLCLPHNVAALVSLCINLPLPSPDPSLPEDSTDSGATEPIAADATKEESPSSTVVTGTADASEAQKKRTRSYIASELLSADVRELADAVVCNDQMFETLCSCLESNAPGELDSFVAPQFAKIISSLLKTRNDETLNQMTRRSSQFVKGLLKHLALPSIAELLVRILDGPEVDRSYTTVVVAPSENALNLLVASGVLPGLAEKFVEASKPAPGSPVPEPTHLRRLREETMTHATLAIQGIAIRVLQLPALGMQIRSALSPYATPHVVMQMLNAGLDAHAAGSGATSPKSSSPRATDDSSTNGFVAATSGTSAALLHALTLAATLMTTDANVARDETAEVNAMGVAQMGAMSGAPGARQMMLGMGPRGGRGGVYGAGRGGGGGIQASIEAQKRQASLELDDGEDDDDSDDDDDDDNAEAERPSGEEQDGDGSKESADGDIKIPSLPEADSPIVSTDQLEADLVTLFERLSQMFGSQSNDEAEGRPLGSLRLKLAEFFVACMKKANESTVDAIVRLGVPKKLTELFLRYEWSSMLHGVVTQSIVSAFRGGASGAPARKAWVGAGLVKWLTDSWQLNEERVAQEEFCFRAGYMGHLIQIGASVQHYVNDQKALPEGLQEKLLPESELSTLEVFAEKHLGPAHRVEVTPLGGERPGQGGGTSDGEDVYEEATEVFDMGEVMEGLSQGDPNVTNKFAKFLMQRTEHDDEEVETVEVGEVEDLSHFGGDDDDDVTPVSTDVDHDIPADMRSRMERDSSSRSTAAPLPVAAPEGLASGATYSGSSTVGITAITDADARSSGPVDNVISNVADGSIDDDLVEQPSIVDSEVNSMELDAASLLPAEGPKTESKPDTAMNFGDSSDDEGTYEEYVDARPLDEELSADLARKLNVRPDKSGPVSSGSKKPSNVVPAQSAAITEIDDGEESSQVSRVAPASEPVTVVEDADSDGDDESGWVEFDPKRIS